MKRIGKSLGKVIGLLDARQIIAGTFLVCALLLSALGLTSGLPQVAQATGSLSLYTSLVVQDLDPSNSMNARVTYFNPTGQAVLTTLQTIAPYRSITLNQPSQPGLPTSFAGTGTLDSDTPFGAVVMEYNGNVNTLGRNFLMDGYTAWAGTEADTTVVLPQLLKNVYDSGQNVTYNSSIAIQNASPTTSASVTVTFTQSTGQAYVHAGISIPPGGSLMIDMPSDATLSGVNSFYGTGRVTATQPVAVVAHNYTAIGLTTYSGFTSTRAATTLYVPQLMKNVYDSLSAYTWSTAVTATSLDGTAANITLTYQDNSGHIYSESQTAAPIATFDQRFSSVVPSGFYGSGKLTANKPIVANVNVVTNYDSNRGVRVATYRAIPSTRSGTKAFLPLLRKNAVDATTGLRSSTGIAGQLVGASATTVTLTYYLAGGAIRQVSQTASPSAPLLLFDLRYDTGLADGSVASGVLTTNPPQPIVAVGNVNADSSVLGDACLYYEGISQ